MASKASCFFCKAESDVFIDGWKLKDGSLAQLCRKCGLAYVNGKFCETFHKGAEGWRDCAVCGKPLHCGCIMSCHKYAPLDVGGVGCSNCLLEVDKAIASGQMTRMLKEMVAKYKIDPTVSSDHTRKVVESLSPGYLQVPSPQFGVSKGDTASKTKVDSETPQMDASTGNNLHPENLLKMTSAEQLPKVSGKSSTASDASCSTGCLEIPKKYAEEQSPRDIPKGSAPVDKNSKADQEQSPTNIEICPKAGDTNLKADQKQTPSDIQTGPMPVKSSMKTYKKQTRRDIQTGPMPVKTRMKTDKKQSPRNLKTSLLPIQKKSDQGQSPRDMETRPTPVKTGEKTDQEESQKKMETIT